MVLVEHLPPNPYKQQSWEGNGVLAAQAALLPARLVTRKDVQCFLEEPRVWMYLVSSKGWFTGWVTPRLKILCLHLSRALSKAVWTPVAQRKIAVTVASRWRIRVWCSCQFSPLIALKYKPRPCIWADSGREEGCVTLCVCGRLSSERGDGWTIRRPEAGLSLSLDAAAQVLTARIPTFLWLCGE